MEECFDAPIKIPVHHVCATDVRNGLSRVLKPKNPRMFEVSTEDAPNDDVLAEAWLAWNEGTNPSHPNFYGYPRIARSIERIDDDLIDKRVQFETNTGRFSGLMVLDFVSDVFEKSPSEVAWSDQHPFVFLLDGIAGELVE